MQQILIRKKYESKNQNKNKFQAFNNYNNTTAATATVASRMTVARISAICTYLQLIKDPQQQQQPQQQQYLAPMAFKHHNSIVFNRCSVRAYSMQIPSRKVLPVRSAIAPIVGMAHCVGICGRSVARVNRWCARFVVIAPSAQIICGNMCERSIRKLQCVRYLSDSNVPQRQRQLRRSHNSRQI